MKPTEYSLFKHNQFIKIDNVVYFVNKILDYTPNRELTKVELIQVYDLGNYDCEYKPDWMLIGTNPLTESIYNGVIIMDGITPQQDDICYTGYVEKNYQNINQLSNNIDGFIQKTVLCYDDSILPNWVDVDPVHPYCLLNGWRRIIQEDRNNNYYTETDASGTQTIVYKSISRGKQRTIKVYDDVNCQPLTPSTQATDPIISISDSTFTIL